MENLEIYSTKEIDFNEQTRLNGGSFWGGVAVGWIVSEVIQGVYQAQQKGFTCK
tara:strand:- start:3244 stop:3405 length:162 start_codon:yes stop_codon:yes gene_type:complete